MNIYAEYERRMSTINSYNFAKEIPNQTSTSKFLIWLDSMEMTLSFTDDWSTDYPEGQPYQAPCVPPHVIPSHVIDDKYGLVQFTNLIDGKAHPSGIPALPPFLPNVEYTWPKVVYMVWKPGPIINVLEETDDEKHKRYIKTLSGALNVVPTKTVEESFRNISDLNISDLGVSQRGITKIGISRITHRWSVAYTPIEIELVRSIDHSRGIDQKFKNSYRLNFHIQETRSEVANQIVVTINLPDLLPIDIERIITLANSFKTSSLI